MSSISAHPARPHRTKGGPSYPRVFVAVAGLALCAAGCRHRTRDHPAGTMPQPFEPAGEPVDGGPPAEPSAEPAPLVHREGTESAAGATGLTAAFPPHSLVWSSSNDGQIVATIRNEGTKPAELRMDMLSSAILSLDVFDAAGNRVSTIPPPMPLTPTEIEQAKEILAPGQSKRLTYSLHIFSPPLPPGTYTVRMSAMPSREGTFTIQPGR